MSAEAEPRRSVRSTKGQHKAHEDSEDSPAVEVPKRKGKKGKKEVKEEIIRCICGATTQDGDPGEPWVGCEECGAWQHNVCMGVSRFEEDLTADYYCEQCKPQNHKRLLAAIKKGEQPWLGFRRKYEEDLRRDKEQKKGSSKKGSRKKQNSPDEIDESQSPAPEKRASTKRKTRDASVVESKSTSKLRKLSESDSIAVSPTAYQPPDDLPDTIADVDKARVPTVKLLAKALYHAMDAAEQSGGYNPADGVTNESRSERLAIAIERAVADAHPAKNAYTAQIRTLCHNIKNNQELILGLLNHTLTPPMLATMTTQEMASTELQKETSVMKARAEKQSILVSEEGPRIRRTHKGEELVGDDTVPAPVPSLPAAQDAIMTEEPKSERKAEAPRAPKKAFDVNNVFRNVKSPTTVQRRRSSAPMPPANGTVEDADVDRLLGEDDETETPPYSPKEQDVDPDVVWRGQVFMNTIGECQAAAKWAAGANLAKTSIHLPWDKLIPEKLTVAGRISETSATEYLCSLRYSNLTDLVVASLSPGTEAAKPGFDALVNYFTSKQRFGVVGDKGVGNVKDTYLVPLLAGSSSHPEFILNLEDNIVPQTRAENMLLLVIVYRNDPAVLEQNIAMDTPSIQRTQSVAGPAFSPSVAQNGFPGAASQPTNSGAPPEHSGKRGRDLAVEILGHYINSTTLHFILPYADNMQPGEFITIRKIFEQEPAAREDLNVLSRRLEQEANNHGQQTAQPPQQVTTAANGTAMDQAATGPTAGSAPQPVSNTPIPLPINAGLPAKPLQDQAITSTAQSPVAPASAA